MRKIISAITMFFVVILTSSIYGAANISVNNSVVNVGNTITVTVNFSGVGSWEATITPSGPVKEGIKKIVGDTGTGYNGTGSGTVTYTTTGTGNVTFTLSGNTTTESIEKALISGTKTVTVNGTSSTPVTPPTATTPPPTTNTQASSNAYLKKLTLSVEGLDPVFNKSKTAYSVSVKENITSIDVSAVPEDGKATYYVSGNKNLVVGENIISVTVTSSDKSTKKTYKISVNKSSNPELDDASLKSLTVEGLRLNADFDPTITEYNCSDVENDVTKLNISANAVNEKAKIEIIGNDSLVVGANTVVIKVTSENATVVKEYLFKFNKKDAKAVNIYTEVNSLKTNEPSKFNVAMHSVWNYLKRHWLVISLAAICLLEFGQILYLYRKIRKIKETSKSNSEKSIYAKLSKRRNNLSEQINTEENTSANEEKELLVEEVTEKLEETVNIDSEDSSESSEENNSEK